MTDDWRHVRCPLCRADAPRLLFPAHRGRAEAGGKLSCCCTSTGLASHGPIVACRECGMVYGDPQPIPSELLQAYRDVTDPTYLRQRRGRELTFARQLGLLHSHAQPPGFLVDVGCYTGVFLELAARAGWRVAGLELSEWAADIAAALQVGEVHRCSLTDFRLPQASADVVTAWDVIEHLTDPTGDLAHVAELLRPGGVLALSTHLIDSAAARLLGTRYPFLMDMHPVHFSGATLRRLLAEADFEILTVRAHRRTIMADYLLERVWSLLPIFRPLFRPLSKRAWVRRLPFTVLGVGLVDVIARRR